MSEIYHTIYGAPHKTAAVFGKLLKLKKNLLDKELSP
jgi:hypothetical protein